MRQRRWELLIDGESIISETDGDQFKMTFDVTIDALGHVSYCDMLLYGLSDSTINAAFQRDSVLGLRAGYVDTIDYIFTGRIRNVFPERDGANKKWHIIARGGDTDRTTINVSLGANTKLSTIISEIASAMGYTLIYTASDFTDTYVRGYKMSGAPEEYLEKLSKAHNFHWTIENNRLVVFSDSSYRNASIQTIDVFAGMEGYPELTEVGVDFAVRLYPKLKIGAQVKVKSEYKTFNYGNLYYQDVPANAGSGTYRMFKIRHSGDTWGNTWTTFVTGYSANYQSRS